MQHGRNNGKKMMAVRIIKHSFEIVHLLTDQNPIQVLVDAIINRCCRWPTSAVMCMCAGSAVSTLAPSRCGLLEALCLPDWQHEAAGCTGPLPLSPLSS